MKKKSDSKEKIYSFSRVNYTCLAAWFMHYEQEREGEDNLWNTGGLFLHNIMEDVANGVYSKEDGWAIARDGWFDAISEMEIPFTTFQGVDADKHYYKKILPFFSEENKNWLLDETLSIEEHLEFTLPNGKLFQGHIDRTSRSERGLAIRDYKISKRFPTKKELKKKARQLYLYAYGYHQMHGEYPTELIFEFFQAWDKPYIIPFKMEDMQEALDWAENRIAILEGKQLATNTMGAKGMFMPDPEDLLDKDGTRNMFCKGVCSYRNDCPFVKGNKLKSFNIPKNQEFVLKGGK